LLVLPLLHDRVLHRTEHGEQLVLLRLPDLQRVERAGQILDERVEVGGVVPVARRRGIFYSLRED